MGLVLAWVWCTKFDKSGDRTMHWGDVWARFPRFVLGYIITFAILLIICLQSPELQKTGKAVSGTLNAFRVIFFLLTFFTIGMVSNFRKLWKKASAGWPSSMWCACSVSSFGLGCSSRGCSSTA